MTIRAILIFLLDGLLAACWTFIASAPEALLAQRDVEYFREIERVLFILFSVSAPKAVPALRVARRNGVCSVATLANGRTIGCAPRLASIGCATQRISR